MNVIICKFNFVFDETIFLISLFSVFLSLSIGFRYIATKSMILVMYVPTYTTIRSIFSKPSDLPITMERINATTYAYATMKRTYGKNSSMWMFNFLSFSGKSLRVTFSFQWMNEWALICNGRSRKSNAFFQSNHQ